MTRAPSRHVRRHPRGSALLLVILAAAIAFTLGLTFLATSGTTTAVAATMDQHAQARQIAESGVDLTLAYVKLNSNWRSQRPQGVWVNAMSMNGGTLSVSGAFDAAAGSQSISITNNSFESTTGQLSNGVLGLIAPTMSGTLGNWQLSRAGLTGGLTSLTVPTIGMMDSASASNGSRIAYVKFVAGVASEGKFNQTLAPSFQSNTTYTLKVDVGTAGLAAVLPSYELRLYAGGTLVATAADSALIKLADLPNGFSTMALTYTTTDTPPAGAIKVELHSKSLLSVVAAAAFDNVRLESESRSPLALTVVGRYGNASHTVRVTAYPSNTTQTAQIVRWSEP